MTLCGGASEWDRFRFPTMVPMVTPPFNPPISGTEPEPPSTTVAFALVIMEGSPPSPSNGLVSELGPLGRRGGNAEMGSAGNGNWGLVPPTGIGERFPNLGERKRGEW